MQLLVDETIWGKISYKTQEFCILFCSALSTYYSDPAHAVQQPFREPLVRKNHHLFPIYRIKADFNLLSLRREHPKSKSKGWKSNFEFESVPEKCDYSQVFCNFSSQLITACLFSWWEPGNQHTNRKEVFSIITTKWCGEAIQLYCALSHSLVPWDFKSWNSIAQ